MHNVKTKYDNFALKRWLLQVGPVRRSDILRKLKSDLERLGLSRKAVRRGLLQLTSKPRVFLGDPLVRSTNGYQRASESSKQSTKKKPVPNRRCSLQSFPDEELQSCQIENSIEKLVAKISITSKRIEGMKKLEQIPELVAENVGSAILFPPMSITSKSIKLNLNPFVSHQKRKDKVSCVRYSTEIRKADSSVPDIDVRVPTPNMDRHEKIPMERTRVRSTIEKSERGMKLEEQKRQSLPNKHKPYAESVDNNVKSNDAASLNNVPRYLCTIDRNKVQIGERQEEINKRKRERRKRRADEERKTMKRRTLDETLEGDVTFSIKRKKKERARKRRHQKLREIFGEDVTLSEDEDEDEVKNKKRTEKTISDENRDLRIAEEIKKKGFSQLSLSKDTEKVLPDSTQIKCDKKNSKVIKDDETKEVSMVLCSRVETIQVEPEMSILNDGNLKKDQFVTFSQDEDISILKVDNVNIRNTLEYESEVTLPKIKTDAKDRLKNCTLPDSSTDSSGEELVKSADMQESTIVQNVSRSTSPILGKNEKMKRNVFKQNVRREDRMEKMKKCVHGRSKESTRKQDKDEIINESCEISDSLVLKQALSTNASGKRSIDDRVIISYITKQFLDSFVVLEDKEKNNTVVHPDSSVEETDSCNSIKVSPIDREMEMKSTLELNCTTTTVPSEKQKNKTGVETSEELTKLLHMNLEEHKITLEGNTISIHESNEIKTTKDISTKDNFEHSTVKDYAKIGSVLLTSSHSIVKENVYDNQMVSTIPLNFQSNTKDIESVQNDIEKEVKEDEAKSNKEDKNALENKHTTGSSPYVSCSSLREYKESESVDKLINTVQNCDVLSQSDSSPRISSDLRECEQDERKDKSIATTKESNVSPQTSSSTCVSCSDVCKCKKGECKDKSIATSEECNVPSQISNRTYDVSSCLDLGISECKDQSATTTKQCKVPSHPRLRVRHPRELGSRWCLTPTPTISQNCNQVPNVDPSLNLNLSYRANAERVQTALDNIFLSIMCSRRFIERQQIANRLSVQRIRREEILQARQDYESKLLLLHKEMNNLRDLLKSWSYHHIIMYIVAALNKNMLAGIRPFTVDELYMILNSRLSNEPAVSNYMYQSNTFGGLLSINSNYQHAQFASPNGSFTPTVNASVIDQTQIFSEKQMSILSNQIYMYRYLSYQLQKQLRRQGGVQSHKLAQNKKQTVIVQPKPSDNQRVPVQVPSQIKTILIMNKNIPNFDAHRNPVVRKEQINKIRSESSSSSNIEILESNTIENKVNKEKPQEDTNVTITSCENTEAKEIEVIFVRDPVVEYAEPNISSTEHIKRTSTPIMKNVESIESNEIVVPNISEVRTISSNQFDNMEEVTALIPSNLVVDEDNDENKINDENSSEANIRELQEAKACLSCGQPSNVLCGVCVEAHYCSKTCQELHWEAEHHNTCNPNPFFRSLSPESSSPYIHSSMENLQFTDDTQ